MLEFQVMESFWNQILVSLIDTDHLLYCKEYFQNVLNASSYMT